MIKQRLEDMGLNGSENGNATSSRDASPLSPHDAWAAPTVAERAEFYQGHLNRVSRSFALCIEQLDHPLREYVGMAYLLCRVLDTVEDSRWNSWREQETAFLEFDGFIQGPSVGGAELLEDVRVWSQRIPHGIPDGERALLEVFDQIVSDYVDLPRNIRMALEAPILSMSAGMRHFAARQWRGDGSVWRLQSLRDVNRYCFFVAGVVAEILTGLLLEARREKGPIFRNDPLFSRLLEDGCRFGLFLQKVNLLKDQITDERVGRYLVPDRLEVFRSLRQDAEASLRYLLSLPQEAFSYRIFCAWSFFLGLASLPLIQKSYENSYENSYETSYDLKVLGRTTGDAFVGAKISREETRLLFDVIRKIADDNRQLENLFHEMFQEIERLSLFRADTSPSLKSPPPLEDISVLTALYRGSLSETALKRLLDGSTPS